MKKIIFGVLILLLCACDTSEKIETKKENTQNGEEVYQKFLKEDYVGYYRFDYGDRDIDVADYFTMDNLCRTLGGKADEYCTYERPDNEEKFIISMTTSEIPDDLFPYDPAWIEFTISGDKTDKDTWEYHFEFSLDEEGSDDADYYWSKNNAYSVYGALEDKDMKMYEGYTCNFIEKGKVKEFDSYNENCNTKEGLKRSKKTIKIMDTLLLRLDLNRDSLEAFADWTLENNFNKQLEVLKNKPQEEKKDD